MRERSTYRSRITGNLLIGSSVIGDRSGETFSTSALHAWRTLPLISIVHAPHTSSRHALSQTGVVVCLPAAVTGWAATHWSTEITFMFARTGTANSSTYEAD